MPSLPPVSAKLIADAEQFISEFRRAERAAQGTTSKVNVEIDKLGKTLNKKFSLSKIGEGVMQGFGIGGAMQLAQTAAETISRRWADAAESAKKIAEYSDQATSSVLDRIHVGEVETDKVARLKRELHGLDQAMANAQAKQAGREHMPDIFGLGDSTSIWERWTGKETPDEAVARIKAEREKINLELSKIHFNNSTGQQRDNLKEFVNDRWEAAHAFRDSANPMREYNRQLTLINELEQEGSITSAEAANAREKAWNDTSKKFRANAKGMDLAILEFSDSFSQAMDDAIINGKNFSEVMDTLVDSIISTFVKMAVINPILNSIFGGVKGWSVLPSLFGGFFADGGTLGAGKWGIAGEAGPELIMGPAEIVPASKLGSGGGNTYYIDARGTDESVVARLAQAIQALAGPGVVERRSMAAYSDNMRRGGAFA